ncbi:MAG TPA: zinc-binding dehydrogenase [Verrucomicrobiae bacterium]|nr:zinc-binding dehydrogenase [Verrucomicrobiae bacterium]
MLALRYARNGEPAVVAEPVEIATPEPGPGEVRLRMLRSPVHNHDLATIRGLYGVKPALPAVGGTELLGVVDALGPGVTGVAPGQRVAAMAAGAWAEYAIADAATLVPVPEAISEDTGAQLLAMPLSAVVLFEELHVQPGQWIVQNAASGAVGRLLCCIAQSAGVGVVNLVRRANAVDELRAYGAKHVVVTEMGWPQRVREIVGDARIVRVVDSVCDAESSALHGLLAHAGEHVIFGALAGGALKLDPGALIFGETVVRGFWMTSWMARASAERRAAAMMRVFELLRLGALPLPVCSVHALRDGRAALVAAETPGRPGKVLLRP